MGRWTGVLTDWCKNGIGYVLVQKHGKCEDITPICCSGGWKECIVGSRFTSAAEQNYSAVEGEQQAVVDGLQKTRFYTQGCDKLLVGVDHKQLLGLLHGKRLEIMDNMRLRPLVEKTYGWSFKVVHIPGRKHAVPDAMSRGGSVNTMDDEISQLEEAGIPCSEVTSHMLAMLRVVTNEEPSQPDSEVDASGELLASMNNAIRSLTWKHVKHSVVV